MSFDRDVRAIARRAAARVFAGEPAIQGDSRRSAASATLVSVECLSGIPDGGVFRVPPDARVTPLAHDEAFRRGIRLEDAGGSGVATPGLREAGLGPVAIASDHGGYALKTALVERLRELGRQPLDLGPRSADPCDYPEYAAAVARRVASGVAALGVVIDGAGIGSAMAANKIGGVLAANCWNVASARNAREHNHANVLTLGAGHLDLAQAIDVLGAFLGTPPGEGRHARRVGLIRALEPHSSTSAAPRA